MELSELADEAEKRGKVSFYTWKKAKRDGVDPDSLREWEVKLERKYDEEVAAYSRYVIGKRGSGVADEKA